MNERKAPVLFIVLVTIITMYIGFSAHNTIASFIGGIFFSALVEIAFKAIQEDTK